MKFVGQRGQQNERGSSQFRRHKILLIVFEASVHEYSQNKVFGDVTKLPYDGMPEINFGGRKPGKEKGQDRNYESGGLTGGKGIRGEEKNRDQPEQEWSPIFEDERLHS